MRVLKALCSDQAHHYGRHYRDLFVLGHKDVRVKSESVVAPSSHLPFMEIFRNGPVRLKTLLQRSFRKFPP